MHTTYIYVFKWFKVSRKTRKTREVCENLVLQNQTGGCYMCDTWPTRHKHAKFQENLRDAISKSL